MNNHRAADIVILVIAIVGLLYVAHLAACEKHPSMCEAQTAGG